MEDGHGGGNRPQLQSTRTSFDPKHDGRVHGLKTYLCHAIPPLVLGDMIMVRGSVLPKNERKYPTPITALIRRSKKKNHLRALQALYPFFHLPQARGQPVLHASKVIAQTINRFLRQMEKCKQHRRTRPQCLVMLSIYPRRPQK